MGSRGQHLTDTLQVLDRNYNLARFHSHPNSSALVRETVLGDNYLENIPFMLSVGYSKIHL